MTVKLLAEHHLEFLSLKGSPESTHVKWKSHVTAHFVYVLGCSSYAKTEMFNNCTKNQGAWCNDACYYGENKTLVQNCTQIEPISPSDDYFQ